MNENIPFSLRYKMRIAKLLIIFLFLLNPCRNHANEALLPLVEHLVDLASQTDSHSPPPLVAIGGCPGVGKTYLTQHLAESLRERNVNCFIFLFDDFILPAAERKKMDTLWDMSHFKSSELHAALSAINSGEKLLLKPTRDPLTGKTGTELVDLNEVKLILFDGLYSLCSKEPLNFFDYCVAGIFIEAEESDILNWRWEREQLKASPRTPQQFKTLMDVYLDDYHKNIEYSKVNAGFIVQKDSDHNYCLAHIN